MKQQKPRSASIFHNNSSRQQWKLKKNVCFFQSCPFLIHTFLLRACCCCCCFWCSRIDEAGVGDFRFVCSEIKPPHCIWTEMCFCFFRAQPVLISVHHFQHATHSVYNEPKVDSIHTNTSPCERVTHLNQHIIWVWLCVLVRFSSSSSSLLHLLSCSASLVLVQWCSGSYFTLANALNCSGTIRYTNMRCKCRCVSVLKQTFQQRVRIVVCVHDQTGRKRHSIHVAH